MGQTLCDLSKELMRDPDAYARLIYPPRFVCENCGRVAAKKKHLCRPRRLVLRIAAKRK